MTARERRRKRRRFAAGAGLGIGAALGASATADAADFTVSTLADSGGGSLRQAVLDANANPGADRILFQSGLSGTLNLTSTWLTVTGPTDFVGPGADRLTITESVNPQGIFYMAPATAGDPISISGLRLSGADAPLGSAILARSADLTLKKAVISGNTASGSAAAVYSYGTQDKLTVIDSHIDGNNGGNIAGAIAANSTQTTITDSTLSGNHVTGSGGAIYAFQAGGSLRLDGVTMAGNNGGNFAGAISANDTPTTILFSTLSGNQAALAGGAIYASGAPGSLTIDTSTVSGNSNPGFGGAMIVNSIPLSITSSTIAANSAKTFGGGLYVAGTTPSLFSSVVADNTAPAGSDLAHNSGSFNAAFSLIENPGGQTINSTGPNITGQDPKLGPLADNGGTTLTQALLPGSPALDAGNASGFDQRGVPRPVDLKGIPAAAGGDAADIGAYEQGLCGGKLVNIVGTVGNDNLVGTSGADGILGLDGKDSIKGLKGKDALCGGDGPDKLKGGKGNDKLFGQAGRDVLFGGKGKDKLRGGPGKDRQIQ